MILYTSPTCKYCPEVKRSLTALGYKYEIRNIVEPEFRRQLTEDLGLKVVPVLVREDKKYIGKDEINLFLKLG